MSSNMPENPYGQQPAAPYAQQAPAPYGQQPGPYGAPAVDPGKTLAIIAIILPFVGVGLVGLILGIVANSKSKKAGYKNTLAVVAIVIGILSVIGGIIATIVIIVTLANAGDSISLISQIIDACQGGSDTVTVGGQEYSCAGY